MDDTPTSLKFVIIGESRVGKTSLVQRYVQDKFVDAPEATIGVDFLVKQARILDRDVNIEVWDTAGQERFDSFTYAYMRGAHVVVCVFDGSAIETSRRSLDILEGCLNYVDRNHVVTVIVSNKCDLNREIPSDIIDRCSESGSPVVFSSAKTGEGVCELFTVAAITALRKREEIERVDDGFGLKGTNEPSRNSCC